MSATPKKMSAKPKPIYAMSVTHEPLARYTESRLRAAGNAVRSFGRRGRPPAKRSGSK